MKIIHVITGLNDGGAEGVLYRLCKHMPEHCHIIISLSGEGKYGELLRAEGFKVYALGMSASFPSPFAFFRLIQLIRKYDPEVVQTWMYHADLLGSIAARILGIKAIVWGIRHSTLEPSKTKKSTILIAKLLSRLSSWLPARIAVCAESAMDEHEALGYDRDKMCFIPNGYDLADFNSRIEEARSLRAKWGVASNIALIGTVGRYHPDKDYNNFLLALAILHARNIPLSCVFVGTNLDNNNKELVEKIKSLRLEESVVLLGQRMDIPAVMSALDLHILSSACEGFPNVVAEAMACETPCVVTDVGDAAYIVGDTGWVVPPHDPKALADSIQQALYMKEQPKWHQLCVSARARIEQEFGIEKMVAGYHELWNEIL